MTRRLHTSHAFHSQMMEPVLAPFTELLRQVKLNKPQIPYVSNVTARWITAAEPGLPWKPGTFLTAYRRKMEDANTDLAEDDSVASAMVDWVDANLRAGASRENRASACLCSSGREGRSLMGTPDTPAR